MRMTDNPYESPKTISDPASEDPTSDGRRVLIATRVFKVPFWPTFLLFAVLLFSVCCAAAALSYLNDRLPLITSGFTFSLLGGWLAAQIATWRMMIRLRASALYVRDGWFDWRQITFGQIEFVNATSWMGLPFATLQMTDSSKKVHVPLFIAERRRFARQLNLLAGDDNPLVEFLRQHRRFAR